MTFPHAMLRSLQPDWNSHGAPAIDERCIDKAFELWRTLSGEWQVVPCSDGGVQLEQHRDGFDIEITVSRAQAVPKTAACPLGATTHNEVNEVNEVKRHD